MRWKGLFALIAARAAASSTPLSIEVATGWPAPPPLLEYLFVSSFLLDLARFADGVSEKH